MTTETLEININDPADKHIETALNQLKGYLKQGRYKNLDQIKWEIRLYEWILSQPEKAKWASQYLKARHGKGLISKQETVKKLGWFIP